MEVILINKDEVLRKVEEAIILDENEMRHICNTILDLIRSNTPIKSGRLRSSLNVKGSNGDYGIYALSYFHYLDKGTRDHWIFPKYKLALRWIDEISGEVCFSKGHKVSGITPMHIIDVGSLSNVMKEKALEFIKREIT